MYIVEIVPSGQKFEVQGHESILEAAIRAGIALDYGCNNGNCGLCKARVIEGEVKQISHYDHVITNAEKLRSYILLCANTCNSNLVIEASIAQHAQDIPIQELRVKTRKIVHISNDLLLLTAQTQRINRLRFLAGQYVMVGDEAGNKHEHAIASCPCDDKHIEFHIRCVEDDAFSSYVRKKLKIGDWLNIRGPFGKFVFDETKQRPSIFIAFDTGFAPIKSMLEHVTAQENERPLHLFWIACGEQRLYLNNLCRSWTDALDQFSYTPVDLAQDFAHIIQHREQALTLIKQKFMTIAQQFKQHQNYDLYICAPDPVADCVKEVFAEHGVLRNRMFSEPIRGNMDLSCVPK